MNVVSRARNRTQDKMVQPGADADLVTVHLGNRVLFTEYILLLSFISYVYIKIFHDKYSRNN
jgi:hypothetical protein